MTTVQSLQPVVVLAPAADAAGRTGDWIKITNAAKCRITALIAQGHADPPKLTPQQATKADGTGAKALSAEARIWVNQDTATSDTLTRVTDAKDFTPSVAVKNKLVIFEIDPSMLDLAGGFTWITLTTGASNAANITAALYDGLDLRYAGDAPPTAIA